MINDMIIFQLAALVLPTFTVLALFIRLGKLLDTVSRLEMDAKGLTNAVRELTTVATRLEAWREASAKQVDDITARVRRLEDQRFHQQS